MKTHEEIKKDLKSLSYVKSIMPSQIKPTSMLEAGGQGAVYRGKVNDSDAAIKIYYPGQLVTRIEREVEALEAISCDNLVRLLWYDSVTASGENLRVVATEFVEGESLSQLLKQRRLTLHEVGILCFDVAQAIESMWSKLIVHRDLKPGNILIRASNSRSCVIDLGVARHIDRTTLTHIAGATMGTIGYLSPEQFDGRRALTCKSDVFALGLVMVECIMGRHPTDYDQYRLLSNDWHVNWPKDLQSWEHVHLLKKMLDQKSGSRPAPASIMNDLERYA